MTKVWNVAPRAPIEFFENNLLHPGLAQVLYNRDIRSDQDINNFLEASYPDLNLEPSTLIDVDKTVKRLKKAISKKEVVGIFTDYDADGITSAAVLANGFDLFDISYIVRIPNRFTDGYGLSVDIVEELEKKGVKCIITADCGSTAFEAAKRAKELGIDLLITDHHQVGNDLPDAFSIVNPWRKDSTYDFPHLCGAGVSYKLVQALADELHPFKKQAVVHLLDLVSIATVADIMPLTGENRIILVEGLKIINGFPRPGIKALMISAGLEPGQVDATALGFRIAPRLNATGRIDDPKMAFDLLMATDYEEATKLATRINEMNQERQNITREYVDIALKQAEIQEGRFSVICGGENWPRGIIGLVASRLTQTYNRPALVYSLENGEAVGSGRSIKGFNLYEGLNSVGDLFVKYGGHPAAAGFTIEEANLPFLGPLFESHCKDVFATNPDLLTPILPIDGLIKQETITPAFVKKQDELAPFGAGFPAPLWAMRGVKIVEMSKVGKTGDHLRIKLSSQGKYPIAAIYFGAGNLADTLKVNDTVDVAFSLKRSKFNGSWKVDMEIIDLRVV